MQVAARTEVGLVRGRNEDDLLVDVQRRVFMVADGLGGHPSGDVASGLAVRTAQAAMTDEPPRDEAEPGAALGAVLHAAHDAVLGGAAQDISRRGMGTTAVLAYLSEDDQRLWVAHVGDSRAYLFHAGELRQLTVDHTIGGRGGGLAQALGTSGAVAPDIVDVDLEPGDRILLCTDGLTDMVDDDGIAARLGSGEPPQRITDLLVEDALRNGGVDNVTVVVIEAGR